MKTYQIQTDKGTFTTNLAASVEKAPVGSTIKVLEMSEAEYMSIPATSGSAAFFG
jgi:hypothetical protein